MNNRFLWLWIIAAILYTRSRYRPKTATGRGKKEDNSHEKVRHKSKRAGEERIDKENKNEPQNYTQTEV